MRIALLALALVLPIAVIGYLQVSDLNRAAARLVMERDGLGCLSRGYAVLRTVSALGSADDPRPNQTLHSAVTRFSASDCPGRADIERLASTDLRPLRSRFEIGLTVAGVMRNIADTMDLSLDASPATVDAATPMAYSLADALPLLGFVSTATDRIDVAKTRATAASRLAMLAYDLADLVQKAPWTASVISRSERREAAAVSVYFQRLVHWVRHPGTPRPDLRLPMRASFDALNDLFAGLNRVADIDTAAQLKRVERRRTATIGAAVMSLALALAVVWLAARRIARRHQIEVARLRDLALKQARFQAIFAGSPLPIAITDLHGGIFECNQAYLELMGVPFAQAERETLFGPSSATSSLEISRLLEPLHGRTAGSVQTTLTLARPDGSAIHCRATATLVRTPGNAVHYCAVMVQDITEGHLRERRLHHAATHDALTGIGNRSHLIRQLERRLEAVRTATSRFALLFVDVDDFKAINDRLGHAAGDACLLAIANRLRSSVRSDDVVARYGGDEFAILLCDAQSVSNVAEIAARLRSTVAAPIEFGDAVLRVSCSVGLAVDGDGDVSDPDSAIAAADRAMYVDKARGGSRAVTILRRCA